MHKTCYYVLYEANDNNWASWSERLCSGGLAAGGGSGHYKQCYFGPSGRCAGGLAAGERSGHYFWYFFLLFFFFLLPPMLKPHKGIT